MIYLDNAATTLYKPACVAEAVSHAIGTLGNASRGAHPASLCALMTITRAREQIASLFHAPQADRVIFTSNATQALNTAILGSFGQGDHVVTTVAEHNSVLRPLYYLQREKGVKLTVLAADEAGRVDPQAFEKAIRPDTAGIVCTHGSNVTGNVTDIVAVGKIAQKHGLRLILDASQTAGTVPVDMEACGINILAFTGHKALLGPQGTGGLCLLPGTGLLPLLRGGSGISSFLEDQPSEYPERLEAGTQNAHGIAGLSAALGWLEKNGQAAAEKEKKLAEAFTEGLCRLGSIRFYGDLSAKVRVPVVSLNIGSLDSAFVSECLSEKYGIATRPGAHCAPLIHRHFGTEKQGMVRFSFSWSNTFEEVEEAIRAVTEISRLT